MEHKRDGMLYYEDLEVGQRFTTGTHQLDAEQIKAFARQFDPQPFHLDEAAAQASFFGELVASGWHTASITMRLLVEGGLPLAGGLIGLGGEMSWPRPTRANARLQAVCEIVALRELASKPDHGLATIRCETRNEHEQVVQVLAAKLLVPRRESPG